MRKPSVLIVSAEASSNLYAQRLLEYWKSQGIEVDAFGIGNQHMEDLGFTRIGKAEELAVVGIQEVLSNISIVLKAFYGLLRAAQNNKPDVVLLMDYPEFNLKLAKKLKKQGFKVVYYISPQVWAWRKGRIRQIKKYIDKMVVLFPFEVDFYKQHNVDVVFSGHPLLDEVRPELLDQEFRQTLRSQYGVSDSELVLGLMPGSRRSELEHHLTVQLETAQKVAQKIPNLKIMLFVAPNLTMEKVRQYIPLDYEQSIILVKREPFEMASMADFILCASGTATLTVGLMEIPMAIMYKMNPLTMFIGKMIMERPKFFGMSNLILNTMISKEFLQDEANPENLSHYIQEHLLDPQRLEQQKQQLHKLKHSLGGKGVTLKVSDVVTGYFNK